MEPLFQTNPPSNASGGGAWALGSLSEDSWGLVCQLVRSGLLSEPQEIMMWPLRWCGAWGTTGRR